MSYKIFSEEMEPYFADKGVDAYFENRESLEMFVTYLLDWAKELIITIKNKKRVLLKVILNCFINFGMSFNYNQVF